MRIDRRNFVLGGAATGLFANAAFGRTAAPAIERVRVDLRRLSGPLPHVWEECVGSDRAAMTLRETWRRDLDRWRDEAGVKRVRFHGIFNDELGVFAPSILAMRDSEPNFQNVDQVYDGLVERRLAPFVELSFMPKRLASGARTFGFYGGNITPPKTMEGWTGFIGKFVVHLLERYGARTVRSWPFEVWNEPNLAPFWSGTQADYFELYKATATTIKGIDPHIPVGGPSTAAIEWLPEFLDYCTRNNAPVDFVTTHLYAGDDQRKLFGEGAPMPQADVIPEGLRTARARIDAAGHAKTPLWLTEWSSDSPAMIAHIIKGALPHCQAMSQWAMSSAFEELGVPNHVFKEGDNGWGMMTHGIARPSFNTYKLLHRLGDRMVEAEGPALASRRTDGSVAILVWNLADVSQPSGIPGMATERVIKGEAKRVIVKLEGVRAGATAQLSFVDQERGSPMPTWRALGSPKYPTMEQMARIRRAAEMAAPVRRRVAADGTLSIDLPPEGVALIEI